MLANDNCTGCGVCALVSSRITIGLDSRGFSRPFVDSAASLDEHEDQHEASVFVKVCPGAMLRAPASASKRRHPVFGAYLEAWQGWAIDVEFRHAGASGGVLSALAHWLVSTGQSAGTSGCGMCADNPTHTVPLRITTRDEALASAGSRYAPVANSTVRHAGGEPFIGKPCEVSGLAQLASVTGADDENRPLLLSFFCAGTPSQHATDHLVTKLGVDIDDVSSLRYRGNGWPGNFEIRTVDGAVRQLSYEESWGSVLGRRLQTRCKLCPDGTGEHADIAVGDYWAADERGFPQFSDAAGNSAIIARTQRGVALLRAAHEAGVVALEPIDLDRVAAVQPLQSQRRVTLAGRLVGRRVAGYRIPRYRDYNLLRSCLRHPIANFKAAAGTFTRSAGLRK